MGERSKFYQQDILSADQFSAADLEALAIKTREMKKLVETKGGNDELKGKLMTALFYEPSSRTFGSFIAAMQRLGGGFLPLQGVTYSSVSKGETLQDTVRTFACYSDVIVIRHPEVGSAETAAESTELPVINAGDGVGEHPTQALLDYYTILEHFGNVNGLTITMVGDLLNGRTVHSLSKLLSLCAHVKLNFVSPTSLQFPAALIQELEERDVHIEQHETLEGVIGNSDVLYITRVQKERFHNLVEYERLKHHYVITPEVMMEAKKDAVLMHPLPRVGEISAEVDQDPRALYLNEQMKNGMYLRMALLSLLLNDQ